MAMPEHDDAYVMDLVALLKALRETRQEAAQVVQQLRSKPRPVGTSMPEPRPRSPRRCSAPRPPSSRSRRAPASGWGPRPGASTRP